MDRLGTITFISGSLPISPEVIMIFSVSSFRCISIHSCAHTAGLCMRERLGWGGFIRVISNLGRGGWAGDFSKTLLLYALQLGFAYWENENYDCGVREGVGADLGTKPVTQYCQKVALSTMPMEGGGDGTQRWWEDTKSHLYLLTDTLGWVGIFSLEPSWFLLCHCFW